MVSFLDENVSDIFTKVLNFQPLGVFHQFLPLKYKFLSESYVLKDRHDWLGMISVQPTRGNPCRLEIVRLFFEANSFEIGKQLVEYVIARYGAKDADSFITLVDSNNDDLLMLFTQGCGFRQCSTEELWKLPDTRFCKTSSLFFRPFKSSDALEVSELYNDSLNLHFKHSLFKKPNEFSEVLLKGLSSVSKFRYVIEDKNTEKIITYFSIKTEDNINFVLDFVSATWCDIDYETLFAIAKNEISKRNSEFNLYVRVKKYKLTDNKLEDFLVTKNAECIRTQSVLVKDFYKAIKTPAQVKKVMLLSRSDERAVYKITD